MTYDYVIGMDVGKYFHHACVLDIDGTQGACQVVCVWG